MDLYCKGIVPITITDINGIKTGIVIYSDVANPFMMWELVKNRLELVSLSLADDSDKGHLMAMFNAGCMMLGL